MTGKREYASFANKKFAMERNMIEKKFEQFAAAVGRGGASVSGSATFGDICAGLGVPESDMDLYLRDNFGLSGPDILKVYEGGIPLYLL